MYGLKLWAIRLEHKADNQSAAASLSKGLLLATFIDVATDGFIIGAGFAAGGETGTILALGLSVELLFLGLSLASEATADWRIVAIIWGIGRHGDDLCCGWQYSPIWRITRIDWRRLGV
jgi:ZIP family zinc transporter